MNFSHLIVLISLFVFFLDVHCSSIVVAKTLFRNDRCRGGELASKNAATITLQPDGVFLQPSFGGLGWGPDITRLLVALSRKDQEVMTRTPPSAGIPLGTPRPWASRVLAHCRGQGVHHAARQLTLFQTVLMVGKPFRTLN